MQKRILKVLLAFMLIMSMTLSNFLLIGISTVNAVEENCTREKIQTIKM